MELYIHTVIFLYNEGNIVCDSYANLKGNDCKCWGCRIEVLKNLSGDLLNTLKDD